MDFISIIQHDVCFCLGKGCVQYWALTFGCTILHSNSLFMLVILVLINGLFTPGKRGMRAIRRSRGNSDI